MRVDMQKFRKYLKRLFFKITIIGNEDHMGAIRLDRLQSKHSVPQIQFVDQNSDLDLQVEEINEIAMLTSEVLRKLPNNFPGAIRKLRELKGFSREGLEEKTGVPSKTIERLEYGKNKPSEENFMKLCLGLELNFIIKDRLLELLEWRWDSSIDRLKLKIILNDPFFDDYDRKTYLIEHCLGKK